MSQPGGVNDSHPFGTTKTHDKHRPYSPPWLGEELKNKFNQILMVSEINIEKTPIMHDVYMYGHAAHEVINPSTLWKASLISEEKIRNVHNPFNCKTVTRRSIYFKIDI